MSQISNNRVLHVPGSHSGSSSSLFSLSLMPNTESCDKGALTISVSHDDNILTSTSEQYSLTDHDIQYVEFPPVSKIIGRSCIQLSTEQNNPITPNILGVWVSKEGNIELTDTTIMIGVMNIPIRDSLTSPVYAVEEQHAYSLHYDEQK